MSNCIEFFLNCGTLQIHDNNVHIFKWIFFPLMLKSMEKGCDRKSAVSFCTAPPPQVFHQSTPIGGAALAPFSMTVL